MDEVSDPRFDFARVFEGIRRVMQELGIAFERIPIIPAGGIDSRQKIAAMFDLGARGVQIGAPFAVTQECDAHPNFKRVLAEAKPEEIVTFMSSAGLPARAVLTPWLKRYLAKQQRLRSGATPDEQGVNCPSQVQCLSFCGFKNGNGAAGQFCIETQLAAAQRGSVAKSLFFRGSESLPFGAEIRSVRELLERLLGSGEACEAL
jgi:nitronate monooxygenase